jgi:acyl carrier protein
MPASALPSLDVRSEIRRIIRDRLGVVDAAINPESLFIEDLDADSLDLLELTLCFEEAFDIDMEDEDVKTIRTVQDAIACVERHIAAQRR